MRKAIAVTGRSASDVERDTTATLAYWRDRALAAEKELRELKEGVAGLVRQFGAQPG